MHKADVMTRCGDCYIPVRYVVGSLCISEDFCADDANVMLVESVFRTCRFDGGDIFDGVGKLRNGLGIAVTASTSEGLDALRSAGRLSCDDALIVIMTDHRNGFLRQKNFAADGAVLALGEACFGTSRSDSLVDNLGMTQRVNNVLRNKDFAADRAVLTFGEACVGAIGFNSLVNDLGMTERVDGILRNENFSANGAMLALGQACVGAIGFNSLVNDFGMTERVNDVLCNDDFSANGAVLAFGQTGVGAIRLDSFINGLSMFRNRNCFGFRQLTNRAGVKLGTLGCTGRINGNFTFVPGVCAGDRMAAGLACQRSAAVGMIGCSKVMRLRFIIRRQVGMCGKYILVRIDEKLRQELEGREEP